MSELTNFLRQKKIEQKQQEANWQKVRNEWLDTLSNFFINVKLWLAEEVNEGLIELEEYIYTLNEEHLGEYKVPALKIKALGNIIYLKPIGRLIIGAQGRVDMESPRGKEKLLYLSSEKGWVYLQDKDERVYPRLDKRLFVKLLKEFLA